MPLNNFNRFDALGTVVGFRIDGHNRKRSALGATLTIAMILVSLLTLGFFGLKYINKDEVFQKNLVENYQEGQTLQIHDDNFHFATKFNTYGDDIYEKAWTMEMQYVTYDYDLGKIVDETILESKVCSKEKWVGVEKEYDINKLSEDNCYTVDNLKLSGNNHYGKISKLELSITINNNVMSNNTLQEIINHKALINPPKLQFYFYNSMFSSGNGKGAINHFIDIYSYEIHLDTYKESTLYISLDELKTLDDKLLITQENLVTAFNTKYTSERSIVRNQTSNINFILDISPSTTKNITVYSFMTFSDMIARVGGIINILLLIFQLIVYIKNYWEFEYKMTQKYFKKINEDITINQCPNKSWVAKNSISHKNGDPILTILDRNKKNKSNIGKIMTPEVNDKINSYSITNNNSGINNSNFKFSNNKNASNFLDKINNNSSNYFGKQEQDKGKLNFAQSNLISEVDEDNCISDIIRNDKEHKDIISITKVNNDGIEAEREIINNGKNDNLLVLSEENDIGNYNNNNNNNDMTPKSNHPINKLSKYARVTKNEDIIKPYKVSDKNSFESDDKYHHHSPKLPKYTKYGTLPNKVKDVNFTDWITLKYFQYFIEKFRLCTCRELPLKTAIYNKIEEYLNRALNIEEIEQRYMDLEMIKLVIFDEQQLRAFQNISFLKAVEDITKYKKVLKQEDSDNIDPQLEVALQRLFSRRNSLDGKLIKYFD